MSVISQLVLLNNIISLHKFTINAHIIAMINGIKIKQQQMANFKHVIEISHMVNNIITIGNVTMQNTMLNITSINDKLKLNMSLNQSI